MKRDLEGFIRSHVEKLEPLNRESSLAYWDASLSGRREDFDRYSTTQMKIEEIYSNREDFKFLEKAHKSGGIGEERLERQVEILYLRYMGNQIDTDLLGEIVTLGARVENSFNVFRAEVDGEELTTNDVFRIMREETDAASKRRVWEACKKVGRIVENDLKELVRLRNRAAREAGFANYFDMSLRLSEQSAEELENLFGELDGLTREPFRRLKGELDGKIAGRFGIEPGEIEPWHYDDPFFQEAPECGEPDANQLYRGKDPVELARSFYNSIGMVVDDIIQRSDLYERRGKNPHAFCTDIDRRGDIRILANIVDNESSMETILHELGHAVYDKYIDHGLPYLLRQYPHLCTTEATAMYFGRIAKEPAWIRAALDIDESLMDGAAGGIERSMKSKQLVFSRWCQTMFHFERGMYADPDRDLNKMWWDIVERFQFVRCPAGRDEPDWATKIHIVASPVYYHNYMLGELIASQFHDYISDEVFGPGRDAGDIFGEPRIGRFFKENVFNSGKIYPWSDHVEKATGNPLSARHFAAQFVGGDP